MPSREVEQVVGLVKRKLIDAEHAQEELDDVRAEKARLKEKVADLENRCEELQVEKDILESERDSALDEVEALRNHYECSQFFDNIVQQSEAEREVLDLRRQLDEERLERWQVEQENKAHRESRRPLQEELEEYRRLYGPLQS